MDFKTLINQGIAKYIKINYKFIENFTKLRVIVHMCGFNKKTLSDFTLKIFHRSLCSFKTKN